MDTELAYLAGFFDGEGCVSISTRGRGGYGLLVSISQLTPVPLLIARARFGGSISRTPDKRGYRAMVVWTVAARVAERALSEMRPFLIVKADEVDLALEFQRGLDIWTDKEEEQVRRARLASELQQMKRRSYDHIEIPPVERAQRQPSPRRLERSAARPSKPKPHKKVRVKVVQPIKSTGYKRHVFDDADIAILRGIYTDYGLAATAYEYGVSRQTVVNWLDRYDIAKQGRTAESEKRRAAAVAASWSTYRSSLGRP